VALGTLELRLTCEHCHKALPAHSLEARLCSYEGTFCADCVERVLGNVCLTCEGGFVTRPIKPSRNWNGDNWLDKDPASSTVRHRPGDAATHETFSAAIGIIPSEKR